MDTNMHDDFLMHLLAQIDRAWADKQDRTLVDRLSSEYPQFEEELRDFFADLVLGVEEQATEDFSEAENSVHTWVVTSGFEIARAARSQALNHTTTTTTGSHSPPLPEADIAQSKETNVGNARIASSTWIALLRRRAKTRLPEIASALPHVS